MRPGPLLLAAVPLAAISIAGCGGGSSDSSSEESTTAPPASVETTAALSKAELIEQGDAICAEVNAAVGSVGQSEASSASRIGQEADLYTGMVERLKGLGTPREAVGYSEFTAAAGELSQAMSNAKLASERGEEGNLPASQSEASAALTAFQSAASSFGFEDCSEGPHAPAVSSHQTGGSAGGGAEEVPEVVEEAPPEPEAAPEEAAPEAVAPETGGAGGTTGGGGTATGGGGSESGGGSGGIGPG